MARRNHVRFDLSNIGDLSIAQSARNVRLENVVRPRRTATQMALGYIFHHESALGKQFFRKLCDFLSVLQPTSPPIANNHITPLLHLPPPLHAPQLLGHL